MTIFLKGLGPGFRRDDNKINTPKHNLMTDITITHFLILSSIVFVIGIAGIFLNRKNIIIILMSIELMLLSININFVAFSAYLGDLLGQIFSLFILTIAAAEAAIGLAILVVYFRNRDSVAVEDVSQMRG